MSEPQAHPIPALCRDLNVEAPEQVRGRLHPYETVSDLIFGILL